MSYCLFVHSCKRVSCICGQNELERTFVVFVFFLSTNTVIAVLIFWLHQGRDTKLQNLDEGTIKDLVGEDNNDGSGEKKKQTDAKKEKVQRRLAAEKKKAESKKKTKKSSADNDEDHDDDDDVDALMTFAKGGAKSKKKR